MGTRADFYVGRGKHAEWLGSIAWDGYPQGLPVDMLRVDREENWRAWVREFLAGREDATTPDMGWPWPWEDSNTTDYAYAFDEGRVWFVCFGHEPWWPAADHENEPEPDDSEKKTAFPNMTARKNTTYGPRSGLMVISRGRS